MPSGVVLGGRGEDKIVVIGTDDTVDGGEGNDLITLDGVAPTVRFGMGSGYDRIVSSGTWLRIELGANIRVGDFSLSRVDGQIILVLTDGSRLDILGAVPSIRFGTGVIWESRAVEVILAGGVFLEGGLGGDILNGEEGADSLWGNDGDDSLFGYDGMDSLIGDLGNDVIWGGEGDDFLEGGAGADFLGGGQGNDLLEGGEGVDCYLLNAGFGSDTIRFYWSEEGGLADKILFKNVRSSSELIFSRLDADSLVVSVVGTSDSILVRDFFHFYSFGGAYSECADVNISYVDEGGVERRVSGNIIREALLAPTSGGDLIIGLNGSNDRIVGLGGDDTLIAIGGEDTLVGGAGSDVYGVFLDYYHYRCVVIDNFDAAAKDEDFDVINGESDMYADAVGVVRVNDDLCLSFARVEDNKSINSLNVFVRGYFYLDGTTSRTVERINFDVQGLPAGGLGYDQIKALASVQAGLNIHGSESNDFITGSAGADSLGGSGGDDVLIGGTGNDIYLVDSTGDIVTEVAAGGTDTVQASVTYTLATEVENLTLTGTSAINGTGNALANVITGNAAANVLDGGAGNDTLSGGLGNNTYLFGKGDGQDYINALDDAAPGKLNVLQLKAGIVQSEVILTRSGYDLVLSIAATSDKVTVQDFFYQDNPSSSRNPVQQVKFSDLTTWNVSTIAAKVAAPPAGNQILTGTSGPDTLRGGAGNDTLDGGAGNDTLIGGAGNDTYLVANAGDVVTEVAAGGTDTVQASVTYTLSVDVENLMLTGESAINGTGNTLANVITGNVVANILSGGAGADRLIGGAGADRLIGGVGADTLIGGVDNDIYLVDNLEDIVTEVAEGGTDTVMASITYSLSAEVENLALALFGGSAINGTGNALDNLITGNAAANTLDGGAGDDMLNGGSGDDTLIGGIGYDTCVGGVGDDTFMLVAGGSDLSGVDLYDGGVGINRVVGGWGDDILKVTNQLWNLVNIQSIEDSDATFGSNTILATSGNDSLDFSAMTINNFVIDGDAGNDVIVGTVGADQIRGGVGNDTLSGGRGDDGYLFGRGAGADMIGEDDTTAGNTDALLIDAGITVDQLWFRRIGSDLEISIIGTTDKATIGNWYSGSAYHVEQFKTADGKILLDGQVDALVSAMAAFSPPTAGQTTLSPALQATLNPVIAANWH